MTRRLAASVMLLIGIAAGTIAAQAGDQKIDLKVLYAGVPDAPRTKDFTDFLAKTFTKVGTVELATLDDKAADGFDVVIVDSPSPYKEPSGFKMPKVPASMETSRSRRS